MNQKKYIFTMIMGFLHCYVYSMEQPNTIPADFFKAGPGYLPKMYKNDFYTLGNIYYDYITGTYKVEWYLKETSKSLSNLAPIDQTRSATFSEWKTIDTNGVAKRSGKITREQKNQIETDLNRVAFFLEAKEEK